MSVIFSGTKQVIQTMFHIVEMQTISSSKHGVNKLTRFWNGNRWTWCLLFKLFLRTIICCVEARVLYHLL